METGETLAALYSYSDIDDSGFDLNMSLSGFIDDSLLDQFGADSTLELSDRR